MTEIPEVVIKGIAAVVGHGDSLPTLALKSSGVLLGSPMSAVIAATFSNPERFPSLAVRVASSLGLPASTPAFDIQMACSAYPYALYLAGRLSASLGGDVLVIDGDVQSPLVDPSDHATGAIFSDACTATLVSCNPFIASRSRFSFLSRLDDALTCASEGPIRMDGFKVFTFVATEVEPFLREFLDDPSAASPDFFAPHQANPYMVRQLADSLCLKKKLLTIPDELKNPGSCSVPLALAMNAKKRRIAGKSVLVAGFGAGYSASAGIVAVSPDFTAAVVECSCKDKTERNT